jgi:5-dehydro-4-deoxyglucarate dehydratase
VLAFSVTPFTDGGDVDAEALAVHVDRLAGGSVGCIVVCGAVGEFAALTSGEWSTCVRTAVEAARGRVPVVAGIGHGVRTACELGAAAAALGAAGLMVNPYATPNLPIAGIADYYRAVADASGLGLMAFSRRHAVYTPETLAALSAVECVVALKDEYGDLALFNESIARFGDRFAWINGMAELLAAPYFAARAQAFTSGLVNFAPDLVTRIWRAGEAGEWERLQRLVGTYVAPIAELRARTPGNDVTVVKEAMSLRGLGSGRVRPPLAALCEEQREELRGMLDRLAGHS